MDRECQAKRYRHCEEGRKTRRSNPQHIDGDCFAPCRFDCGSLLAFDPPLSAGGLSILHRAQVAQLVDAMCGIDLANGTRQAAYDQ